MGSESSDSDHLLNLMMRRRSGSVRFSDDLTSFLYVLMRDQLSPGVVEELVREAENEQPHREFSNGWLANYAHDLAKRLRLLDAHDDYRQRLRNLTNFALDDVDEKVVQALYEDVLKACDERARVGCTTLSFRFGRPSSKDPDLAAEWKKRFRVCTAAARKLRKEKGLTAWCSADRDYVDNTYRLVQDVDGFEDSIPSLHYRCLIIFVDWG